ncbi:peptide/nickel transport system permease protein [Hamadaea flava]|uniref:ABC transporter permease n=1 Tax=Hamadaea flava TaxID=1742688 RepID=A0ABV8LUS4_9ACTN|nr:ABC transporter permease [Hamadaea flava]MCP2328191.1 peptide/nickel transport system permease protein [Hamadaea flava]
MTAVLATPTAPVTDVPRTRRRPSGKLLAGLGIAAAFVLLSVLGPLLTGDPEGLSYDQLQAPSGAHWLGTTNTGQDVLAQLMSATRGSLTIGVLVGVFATAFSLIVGVVGGYLGGWLDESFSLLSNVFLVLPGLPLVILITDYTETKGLLMIAAIISVTAWAGPARVLRAQTLSLRNRDYVDAARVAGEPGWRIVAFEILPNLAPIVAAQFVFAVLGGVLVEVGLAFLGLAGGASGSWGGMLYYALSASALPRGAWWWFVPPGLFCALLGTGLSLINFAIDERVNPRLRKEAR